MSINGDFEAVFFNINSSILRLFGDYAWLLPLSVTELMCWGKRVNLALGGCLKEADLLGWRSVKKLHACFRNPQSWKLVC